MSIKKVVHYVGTPSIMGNRAILTPVDHPDGENVSNYRPATTSRIVRHDPVTGVIETQNTVYQPLEKDDDPWAYAR